MFCKPEVKLILESVWAGGDWQCRDQTGYNDKARITAGISCRCRECVPL